jgi:hypothetical protein
LFFAGSYFVRVSWCIFFVQDNFSVISASLESNTNNSTITMKKFLTLFLSCLSVFATAQVTLSQSSHGWNPGTNWIFVDGDTNITQGPSGMNQTWNFSTLTYQSPFSLQLINVAGTPYAGLFPQATTAINESSGFYDYLLTDATGNYYTGYGSASDTAIYSDPQLFTPFPFAYGNNRTDFYQYANAYMSVSGNESFTADGTGTLILPSGSFTALRVHETINETDSANQMSYIQTDAYEWFTASSSWPVLEIIYETYTVGSSTFTDKYVRLNIDPTGVAEQNNSSLAATVFPNPVKGQCTISASLDSPQKVTMEIFDLAGKLLLSENHGEQPAGNFQQQPDISKLGSGVYLLRISAGEAVSTQKLIIE